MPNGEELAVGDVLDDKYVIEALIGRGGMGAVYRARHVRLDSHRAIKVVRPELAQDDAFIRRFRNEALLAEGVRHPNVVALYDFSTLPDGTSYIVWEYVEGATVGQLLSRGAVFTESEVAIVIENVADGLVTAHRQGILHRDVSPDNIMICSDAQGTRTAKLLDFGVAKGGGIPGETPTDADLCFGKVGYASPEQMGLLRNEEQLDERTDLFSLAAVTFAMLVGESPFGTSSMQAFIHDLMIASEVEVQGRFLARVAEPWRGALSRALARDREVRTATVEEFIAAVREAAAETSIDGTPKQKPVSRRWWLYASAALVVAGVVAFRVVPSGPSEPPPIPSTSVGETEVISTNDEPKGGTAESAGGELSPKEDWATAPRRPEKVLESPPDKKQAPLPARQKPVVLENPIENDSPPDDPRPNVEETSRETGVTGWPREGEKSPSLPDQEAGPQVRENASEPIVPAEPSVPSPSGESSEGEGPVVEDDTSTPTPPQASEPRLIQPAVQPEYPAIAKSLYIEGVVTVRVVISAEGDVTDCRVVNSIPLLDKAAIDAVLKWKFEPSRLNGEAVPAEIIVEVRFELTS